MLGVNFLTCHAQSLDVLGQARGNASWHAVSASTICGDVQVSAEPGR